MVKPLVYVALDYNDQESNLSFARELSNRIDSDRYGFKINLDSIADFSPNALNPNSFINRIGTYGKSIFVDMKMWNGGRTMENIARGCADLGIDILNMYPHAGGKFMRRVAKALDGSSTMLFGLTVLTHYTNDYTQRLYGKDLGETVKMLAQMSLDSGANGIVLPGTQLGAVGSMPLFKLCPGIRPPWYSHRRDNFQEQTVTPTEAIRGGADYIVVGSPIRKSKNRPDALKRILSEM